MAVELAWVFRLTHRRHSFVSNFYTALRRVFCYSAQLTENKNPKKCHKLMIHFSIANFATHTHNTHTQNIQQQHKRCWRTFFVVVVLLCQKPNARKKPIEISWNARCIRLRVFSSTNISLVSYFISLCFYCGFINDNPVAKEIYAEKGE